MREEGCTDEDSRSTAEATDCFRRDFRRPPFGVVRAHLGILCDIIQTDEVEIVSQLAKVDVLVTMACTPEMGAAGRQLKLVQVLGAGLDRAALPTGTWLANAYGHEIGIAENIHRAAQAEPPCI